MFFVLYQYPSMFSFPWRPELPGWLTLRTSANAGASSPSATGVVVFFLGLWVLPLSSLGLLLLCILFLNSYK